MKKNIVVPGVLALVVLSGIMAFLAYEVGVEHIMSSSLQEYGDLAYSAYLVLGDYEGYQYAQLAWQEADSAAMRRDVYMIGLGIVGMVEILIGAYIIKRNRT
ncbi:MAG: hypothetical protein DRO01_04745 [Thermoproteota archaeon]|nr:MAG: hypothetical protein DRO01_04745 [Candidatus Korarchaeota archaeon]